MKIAIYSSAYFVRESYRIKNELEKRGHVVFMYPDKINIGNKTIEVIEFYTMRKLTLNEKILQIKRHLMKAHIKNIEKSDAILVLNFDKDVTGYIGGNTFLEMAIAYYLKKKIYLWKNPSKDLPYYEEILAMKPTIIDGDLEKIV